MRTIWLLPPLAAVFVAGAVWIVLEGRPVKPEILLASARAHLAKDPPERADARRDLDQALRFATGPAQRALRAELLDARSELYALEDLPGPALEDCRVRLEESGPDADVLERAGRLALVLGDPAQALEYARSLTALDAVRGQALIGRCHVALSDAPFRSLERLAQTALAPSQAVIARVRAQRAALLADAAHESAAREELIELFTRPDERRLADEWLREAGEHLQAARVAFVASLAKTPTSASVAGFQDLLLRAGDERETAEIGELALTIPDWPEPMNVLARTVRALVSLQRDEAARTLIRGVERGLTDGLDPASLPSDGLRDELLDWCLMMEHLELWNELRMGAWQLSRRSSDDRALDEEAKLLLARADLRQSQYAHARDTLDDLGTPVDPAANLTMLMMRAEIARGQKIRTDERFALLALARAAPADPPKDMREDLGRAFERLAELQRQDGDVLGASTSLTRALACSSARAAELQPLWDTLGREVLGGSAGLNTDYGLYVRAKVSFDNGQFEDAQSEAQTLLAAYPGLGPALEIASGAAHRLKSYPRMIETSLELLARGWPANAASGRLRGVPKEYFLPQDRLRWFELDPRGSLEAVMRRMLERGNVEGAALAARGGPARFQPLELLPLLARTELAAGDTVPASETLALLPADSAPFRASTGLALRIALARARPAQRSEDLAPTIAKLLASGPAQDPELVPAVNGLLAANCPEEARALLDWILAERTPFLAEALLSRGALDLLAEERTSDALERAEALLEDGRTELGRMLLELERGDAAALKTEARAAAATPLAGTPARTIALWMLAGEPERAAAVLDGATLDGRDGLLELVAGCAWALAPDVLHAHEAPECPPPAVLGEGVAPERLLLLALAAEVPPWSAWVLRQGPSLPPSAAHDARVLTARVLAALALDLRPRARSELALGAAPRSDLPHDDPPRTDATASAPATELPAADVPVADVPADVPATEAPVAERPAEPPEDAGLAWLRARTLRALGDAPQAIEDAELAWLHASGRAEDPDPALATLQAADALGAGRPLDATHVLERALEKDPKNAAVLSRLAELENTPGRRTRALDLQAERLADAPRRPADPGVLAYLDMLRDAREAGEISETRWWSEVEALEAERPDDPAPVRELAARSFERKSQDGEHGRADALDRLARFRARTLGRPIESLRVGETRRWTELLMQYSPERAADFAEEELRRDPADPVLWRASAEALDASGDSKSALTRLEALERVAPELETTRQLALLRFGLDREPKAFAQRLANLARLAPETSEDVVLSFYSSLIGKGDARQAGMQKALDLWAARAENGLASPEAGRALALALYEGGRSDAAATVLRESHPLARSALEEDVLAAMWRLVRAAPIAKHEARGAARPKRSDDAPGAPAAAPAEGAKPDAPPAPQADGNADGNAGEKATDKSAPGAQPTPKVPPGKKGAGKNKKKGAVDDKATEGGAPPSGEPAGNAKAQGGGGNPKNKKAGGAQKPGGKAAGAKPAKPGDSAKPKPPEKPPEQDPPK